MLLDSYTSYQRLFIMISFHRDCNGNSTPFLNPNGFCRRSDGCANTSKCGGLAKFPEDHLAVSL